MTTTDLPAPEIGKTVNLSGIRGNVTIRLRGANKRTALDESTGIPVGAIVDATKGSVSLTTATGEAGRTQTARFSDGAFTVTQPRRAEGMTTLTLTAKTRPCVTHAANSAANTKQSRKRKIRRLWGDGHGRFRVRGRHAAAIVRGTRWLVEDRCAGTLIEVARGKVVVRDYARQRTVVVKRGKRYLARSTAKRPREDRFETRRGRLDELRRHAIADVDEHVAPDAGSVGRRLIVADDRPPPTAGRAQPTPGSSSAGFRHTSSSAQQSPGHAALGAEGPLGSPDPRVRARLTSQQRVELSALARRLVAVLVQSGFPEASSVVPGAARR